MKKTSPSQPITQQLSPSFLLKRAGQKYYERGESYYKHGYVSSIEIYGDLISATVEGTETYQVQFLSEDGKLVHECSCPLGDDGEFCKHCVAVGLTVIEQTSGRDQDASPNKQNELTLQDVKNYLLGQEKDFLVELVMRQVMLDSALRAKLFLGAANTQMSMEDRLKNMYQWIDQTLRLRRNQFLEYDQVPFYSQKVQAVIPHLEDLFSQGYAQEVVLLTEYALGVLDQSVDQIEETDSRFNESVEALEDLRKQAKRKIKTQPRQK